ncbi:MAG: glutathione S-transferase family protein [Alphaproteobacteria bacterium]|nr:glutathione S-transferase family protein [Alphaproteobacteria bacterium]
MIKLYNYGPSGNGYKVALLLNQLGLTFETVEVDANHGGTRTPEFLAINPAGKIPVVVLTNGVAIAESNAILWYFAERTAHLPEGRLRHARVLQWMFFEQYSHEPYIAVARNWVAHTGLDERRRRELPEKHERGLAALGVMERRLSDHPFLVADRYTIADIALFAYTHVAHEGGFDMSRFPAIRAWIDRVREQPGHVALGHG